MIKWLLSEIKWIKWQDRKYNSDQFLRFLLKQKKI